MIAKRFFDIVASLLALVALVPVFAVFALLIKIDSPGSVFFRQQRVGRGRRSFYVHKFRSMYAGVEGALLTADADTRVTRIGRWLRKYRLDELPQIFDVLMGDMSLVGPRPEVPKYMDRYPAEQQAKILSIRPGITDWASIRFKDEAQLLKQAANPEAAYIEQIVPIKAKMHVEYIEGRSFWGDIKILCATFAAMTFRR